MSTEVSHLVVDFWVRECRVGPSACEIVDFPGRRQGDGDPSLEILGKVSVFRLLHFPNWKDTITLAIMESNPKGPSPDEAAHALDTLAGDRDRLAASVHVPGVLLAAFGAVGAFWVATASTASPGGNYNPSSGGWLALVGTFVVVHLLRRETGVRFRAMGVRAGLALAGSVAICLVLFSVSLGFVSFGLRWPVALISVVAFAATTWLAGIAYRSAVELMARE